MGNSDGGSDEKVKKEVRKNKHLYLRILRRKGVGGAHHTMEGLVLHRRRGRSFIISEWSERDGGGLIHSASGG